MTDAQSTASARPRSGSDVADSIQAYAAALAMVAASTLIGLWIAPRWGTAPVDMIYLPAVLGAAALWGLGPGLVAGVTSTLAYNFFFTQPVHTLRIDRVGDVVTVAVLLIVALVTGRLAAGIRKQARIADAHAARNAVIAGFARRLLSCSTEDEIARVTGGADLRPETISPRRAANDSPTSSSPTSLAPSAADCASSPSTMSCGSGGRAPVRQSAVGAPSASTSAGASSNDRHSSPPACSCVHTYSSPGRPTSTDPATSSNASPRMR